MRKSSFWLRVLNVYPSEWRLVRQLYLFQFFQGAGIAFFFTSAFAQFLEKFPITELPWVMIYSAILLWVAGFLYTRLEHTIKFHGFNLAIVVLMAASVVLLWVANYQLKQDWFLYFLLAWFNVLYLLNNLQFWGIAAMLFDLRQSKRLFAVISAGDIPAKFIGYTLALIFVPYIGTQNLLLLGAICMLVSLPLFKKILQSGHLEAHHKAHKKHHEQRSHKKISTLVNNIATSSYIRRIAFISLLTSICVILVNYGFYGEVRKAYHDDVELAEFIAFFYAALRLAAFITKMVFTSRLTASWGVRQTLFITPLGMLVFIGAIVVGSEFSVSEKLIFYLFGVASMIVDVLRTSFNSPVLLTLMQPLHTYERLRAHNIVKGIMDPFASLLSGIFLLALFYMHGKVDLMFLCYVLLVLGILWLIGVALVNRQYLQILVKTVSSRYFSREEFDLNDDAIREQIRKKMMNGTDLEVISIMRMLSSKIDAASEDLFAELLHHPSTQVKLEALRLIKSRSGVVIKQRLDDLLRDESIDSVVKAEAVKTLCKIGDEPSVLYRYLNSDEPVVRQAAITGTLGNHDGQLRGEAEKIIGALLHSDDVAEKKQALAILSEVKDDYDHPDRLALMNDPDITIKEAAITSIGKSVQTETLNELGDFLVGFEKPVLAAFYNAGDKAIPVLKQLINSEKFPPQLHEKLITLVGKIGGDKAGRILVPLLTTQPYYIDTIIKSLYRSRYAASGEQRNLLERIAHSYLIYGVELLYMQKLLEKKELQYDILNNSLSQEINEIREVLLCLFACLYDRHKINQVKQSLNTHNKDSIANSMEIIELTVRKDIGKQFNTLFETIDVDQRCTALHSLFTKSQFGKVEHILERILSEKPIQYYNWTKACSMYISKKYVHHVNADLYKKFIGSENKLLQETALFAGS